MYYYNPHPMLQRFLLTAIILVSSFTLLSQNTKVSQKRSIVYPFKELLKDIDTLVIQGGPRINKGGKVDTLYKESIEKLANLYFQNKDFSVEAYGVTPGGSIEFFHNGKRIVLIGCWDITDTYYAVNVSLNGQFAYHGLLINKKYFDGLFEKFQK